VEISEFLYDAPGADTKNEWIELFNAGTSSVDITKWKINDGSNHVFNAPPKNGSVGSTVMAPGSYLILADDAVGFVSTHSGASVLDSVINLPNDGGMIKLLDAAGKTEDSVKYSKSKASGDGNSLQKNASGKWIAAAPTPGAGNAQVSPKPVKVSEPKKTAAKTQARPPAAAKEAIDIESEVQDTQDVLESTSSQIVQAAAAASSGSSPWYLGAAGLIGAAAATGFIAKRKKSEEWEIIEETG